MRHMFSALVLSTAAAFATPAFADTALPATPQDNGGAEIVPNVAPGDEIVVACAPIEHRDANADVRVVLSISAVPEQLSPGYNKVLATDEEVSKYGVKVRIPDVPDLPDHTVNLNVYVVGQKTADCDGGHLRVVGRGVPDFRHDLKPHKVS
ncbi:MAG TPA: hypothetical protein VGM17_06440 [Rhizomicrobium sp.]|jgi:hypothetical protein